MVVVVQGCGLGLANFAGSNHERVALVGTTLDDVGIPIFYNL